ncbi:hypothetical protein GEMRC1_011559 [Eukaryota sp. GEM-RC1]
MESHLEDYDDMQDTMAELHQMTEEVTSAFSFNMPDVDDAELEAEFEQLQTEELYDMPTLPIRSKPSQPASVPRKELLE